MLTNPAERTADDDVIRLSEEEKLARRFQDTFGLSESEARRAVDGRDGGRSGRSGAARPVSEAEAANLRPDPAYVGHVIRKIEEVASDLTRRGASDEAALRESAFAMFRHMPNEVLQEWVSRIIDFRWPGLLTGSGSSGGSSGRPVREG